MDQNGGGEGQISASDAALYNANICLVRLSVFDLRLGCPRSAADRIGIAEGAKAHP